MKINNYKDMIAWQKSRIFVKEIYEITSNFPEIEKFGLVSQIRRAAISIPSNIAEGWSKKSTNDFLRFLNISLGSTAELETQLILSADLNFITTEKLDRALTQTTEISKIINGLITSLKRKNLELASTNS